MRYYPSPVGSNIVVPGAKMEDYNEAFYFEQLKVYRETYGFSYVEFSHVFQLDEAACKRLRMRAMELGITIWSVHSWHLNEWTPEAIELYRSQQQHHAMISGALGCSVMICHLPNISNRSFEQSLEIMTMVADQCCKYGVRLAIETVFAGDEEEIIKVVDTLDRDDVGINVDTGHCNFYLERSAQDVIRQCGKRIITLHLQDNYEKNDDHQMPGMGTIDWFAVIKALKDVDYSGPLMMEMGHSGKVKRTVPQLRTYELEKELVQGGAWLDWLWTIVK